MLIILISQKIPYFLIDFKFQFYIFAIQHEQIYG